MGLANQTFLQAGSESASVEMEIEEENDNIFRLKRLITPTKEEYYIDGSVVSQIEYRNFLEGKNLSQTNSYFIIPQSQITAVSNQSNEERYDLLKDICGAKQYETKKDQSIGEINHSNTSLNEIGRTLSNLEHQQTKLATEKEVFDRYTMKNNELRSLQYNLYKKELDKATAEMNKVEVEIKAENDALEFEYNKLKEIEEKKNKICEENKQNVEDIKLYNEKISSTEEKLKNEIIKKEEKLKKKEMIEPELVNEEVQKSALRERLEIVKRDKIKAENEINNLKEEYSNRKEEFERIETERNNYEIRHQELLEKRRRCSIYTTEEERNGDLDKNINELKEYIKDYGNRIIEKKKMVKEIDNKNQLIENEIRKVNVQDFDKERQKYENDIKNYERDIRNLTEKENNINNEIEILSKEIEKQTSTSKTSETNYYSYNKSIIDAIKYLNEYCNQHKIKGYYGPLIDLFTLKNNNASLAVEIAAGNKLFNCIVDNTDTAIMLLNVLREKNKGRITFIPLNEVLVKNELKVEESRQFNLMTKLLKYNMKFEKAFRYVFANTIFCLEFNIAKMCVEKYRNNCVTINGTEVKSKGEVRGGYRDKSKCILDNYIIMNQSNITRKELNEQREKKIKESDEIKVTILQSKNSLSSLISTQSNRINEQNRILIEMNENKKKISSNNDQKSRLLDEIKTLEYTIREHQIKIKSSENEKQQEFSNELEDDENNELNKCQDYLNNTYSDYMKYKENESHRQAELNTKILQLRNLLDEENRINIQLTTFTSDGKNILEKQSEYDKYDSLIKVHDDRIKRFNEVIDNLKERLNESTIQQNNTQIKEDKITVEYDEVSDLYNKEKINLDRLESKYNLYKNSTYIKMKAIRDLGSLLQNQLIENSHKTKHQLRESIKTLSAEVNEEYTNVNQKAVQQFDQIKKTYDDFLIKYRKLNDEKNDILNYVSRIDEKERKIITDTFSNLNISFGRIFKSIIPQGKAELLLQYNTDDNTNKKNKSKITDNNSDENKYIQGISINVCFDKSNNDQLISQLSGGQKTIVAVAFLFALQEISKAPFYLFDEIDDALDPKYRQAISRLIEMKKPRIQFIATTFKKEMVDVGDNFIKVESIAQKSEVHTINKEEAQSFIVEKQ